jgi:formylglycine-generating enzyme required for sulfatase activity
MEGKMKGICAATWLPGVIAAVGLLAGSLSAQGLPDVLVEGGSFVMGSDDYSTSTEGPAHPVRVDSFRIAVSEISYGLFGEFVAASAYRTSCELDGRGSYVFDGGHAFLRKRGMNWATTNFAQAADSPACSISWIDAVNFANWLSRRDGLTPAYDIKGAAVAWNRDASGWRLPTEAEWEFAARGGLKGSGCLYAGSNELGAVAWYDENSRFTTHPRNTKLPNELGLYDMTGNVYEWCWDWYAAYPARAAGGAAAAEARNPAGPDDGVFRCYRGGSWYSGPWVNEELRTTTRSFGDPAQSCSYNGFRLVRKP